MAEQYTEVFNLFDIKGAILPPFNSGPNNEFKLQLLYFSDGRIQFTGQAYIQAGGEGTPIQDNQLLFNFENTDNPRLNEIFSNEYEEAYILMGLLRTSGLYSVQLNMARYGDSFKGVGYHHSVLGTSVIEGEAWKFDGLIIPKNLSSTGSLLWGK